MDAVTSASDGVPLQPIGLEPSKKAAKSESLLLRAG
jgi:hypothetical protein